MIGEFLARHNIEDEIFAAGVSGGADSLAMVLMLHDDLKPLGKKIIALTVDHKLRPESGEEALYVAEVLGRSGIEHHILSWEGPKPEKGIEEAARQARYALMSDWCRRNGIEALFTAHHLEDQAETFLMRLQRGSGLNGLCGMSEVSCLHGLRILRPLLSVEPAVLRQYLADRGLRWVEDPSNRSDEFLRCRIRKLLPIMAETAGITPRRIVQTMGILARSRDYFETQVAELIDRYARFWGKAGVRLPDSLLTELPEEMSYRLLSALIKAVGERDYVPRSEDVQRLAAALRGDSFRGATLGGCALFYARRKMWIVKEVKDGERLSKKAWEEFTLRHAAYKNSDLPYKLRLALVCQEKAGKTV